MWFVWLDALRSHRCTAEAACVESKERLPYLSTYMVPDAPWISSCPILQGEQLVYILKTVFKECRSCHGLHSLKVSGKGLVMDLCPQHLQLASKHFLVCPKRITHQPVKKVKTQEDSNAGLPAIDKELKSSRNSCMEYIAWTHMKKVAVLMHPRLLGNSIPFSRFSS